MGKQFTPGQLGEALRQLPLLDCLTAGLEQQALRLVESVKAKLELLPGEPHDQPWQQTGALRDSISMTVTGLTAQIGSNDPAAAAQEFGTLHVPPRPFMLPALDPMVDGLVAEIGTVLRDCLASHVA